MISSIIKVLMSNFLITVLGLVNSFVFPIIMSVEDYSIYQEFKLYSSYVNACHLGMIDGMFLFYGGKDYKTINKEKYKSEIILALIIVGFFSLIGIILSVITKSSLIFKVMLAIYPVCMISGFKVLYQAWNRFTTYSLTNTFLSVGLTFGVLIKYWITGIINGNTVIIIFLVV